MNLLPGSQILTDDGAVGVSGKSYRLECVHLISLTSAAAFCFFNGTTASATKYVHLPLSSAGTTTVNFQGGLLFPAGCYMTVDAVTVGATVIGSVVV